MSSSEIVSTKKGLGRGLGSLLGGVAELVDETTQVKPANTLTKNTESSSAEISDESRIWLMGTEKVHPNPRQPRKEFDPDKLRELAASIKEKGILQPIIARKVASGFEIVAGERRWRAAQLAGLQEVPIILKKAEDAESLELALIENIQRHDLNPIDEAEAYLQLADRFEQTQEQIAKKVGKDRSTITNMMRLLQLAPTVREMVRSGQLTTGHAKVLLGVSDPQEQQELAKKIINLRLSVRAAEGLLKTASEDRSTSEDETLSYKLAQSVSNELQKLLGTKVQIDYSGGKGKLSIFYYSDDEFNQLIERLRKTWKN